MISKLLFVDTETTGLDPEYDQVIEVAAAVLDLATDTIVVEYQTLVQFMGHLPAFHTDSGRFANVDWGTAVHPSVVVQNLQRIQEGLPYAGQNPTFDLGFLKAMFRDMGVGWNADYHLVDTATIGHFLEGMGITPGVSLRHLRGWAGRDGAQEHRAMADVKDSIAVYRKFRDMLGLIPWTEVRS